MKKHSDKTINESLAFSKDLIKTLAKELVNIKIPNQLDSILVTSLFLRVLEFNKGILTCLEAKTPISALVMLRAKCETFLHLTLASRSEQNEFAAKYINHHITYKVNNLIKLSRDLERTKFTITRKEIEDIKLKTESDRIPGHKSLAPMYSLFAEAELIDLYHGIYTTCSSYVHSDAQSLNSYFDNTKAVNFQPDKDVEIQTIFALSSSISLMKDSTELYLNRFKIESNTLKYMNELAQSYSEKLSILYSEILTRK